MLKLKSTIAAAAALTIATGGAHAASMIIDDFDQALSVGTSLSGMAELVSNSDMYTSPDMIDWVRTLTIDSSIAGGENIIIGNNFLTGNSGNLGAIVGTIRWELADTSGGLDISTANFFKADIVNGSVSSSTGTVDASLTLVSGIGTMSEMSFTFDFNLTQGQTMLVVDIDEFLGNVDLTDIDAIVLGYTSHPNQGVDFTLENALVTTAVPVPGAVLLMGSALAGLGAMRRRRA
ncbi:MAG: VPLPA-CTERM sorting domain-containing protein [Pseudomonadota bacterium]